MEALRDAIRDRRCTPDAIARYAVSCGVWSVVRPYLEAVALTPQMRRERG